MKVLSIVYGHNLFNLRYFMFYNSSFYSKCLYIYNCCSNFACGDMDDCFIFRKPGVKTVFIKEKSGWSLAFWYINSHIGFNTHV